MAQNVVVLIETSWNVKAVYLSLEKIVQRINRNIVECKAKVQKLVLFNNSVLIETSWNVKQVLLPVLHMH